MSTDTWLLIICAAMWAVLVVGALAAHAIKFVVDAHGHVTASKHADANLTTTAPELLAELITCRHDLARMLGELRLSVTVPGTDTIPDEADEALCFFEETRIARLDALIAKATRTQPTRGPTCTT